MPPIPHLPIEIWVHFITFFPDEVDEGRQALKALSLTCSSICTIAQPLLFRCITLSTYLSRSQAKIESILNLLNSHPESTRWTKKLQMFGSPPNKRRRHGEMPNEVAIAAVFVRMQGLESVRGAYICFTRPMLDHLWQLKLRSFRVRNCEVANSHEDLGEAPSITRLSIEGMTSSPPWWRLMLQPTLLHLTLSSGSTAHAYTFLRLHPSHIFSQLHSLSVEGPQSEELESFVQLLSSCPALTILDVGQTFHPFDLTPPPLHYTLPETTLPFLSTLCSPLSHAKATVPGRPVTAIKLFLDFDILSQMQMSRDDCLILSQSTAPVTHLELMQINWYATYASCISESFPALIDLGVWVDSEPRMRMVSPFHSTNFRRDL